MAMREDCKHFESRTYPNGDTLRQCTLNLAPEAPWRCPENCTSFELRRVDVNWAHQKMVMGSSAEEPEALRQDEEAVRGLFADVANIIGEAEQEIMEERSAAKSRKGLRRIIPRRRGRRGKKS